VVEADIVVEGTGDKDGSASSCQMPALWLGMVHKIQGADGHVRRLQLQDAQLEWRGDQKEKVMIKMPALNITFGDLSLPFLLKRCADAGQACRGR
jgi:hypothetical protein